MDPQACLELFLTALAANDLDSAAEHMVNLRNWLRNDGFAPRVFVDGRGGLLVDIGYVPGRQAVVRFDSGKHMLVPFRDLSAGSPRLDFVNSRGE